ncbi:MAG: helicase-related protein [Pseudomonadales bacterium]|nr:helicase-related protein [Pseudomonadales bacterium]
MAENHLSMPPSVAHPLLSAEVAQARAYQLDAVRAGLGANTLLVLPTGTGKTPIAWMVVAERLREMREIYDSSSSKRNCPWILMVAPTNPLVVQHHRDATTWLELGESEIVALTGKISPEKRQPFYDDATLVISTPQVIRNDVNSGTLSLADCVLLVADEAHHSTGNHAMAQVGDLYGESASSSLVLACTASPGSTEQQVSEVCDRLGIERIIAKRSNDPMVSPYQQSMDIVELRLPIHEKIIAVAAPLNEILADLAQRLQRQGFLVIQGGISSRALRDAQQRISQAIAAGRNTAYQAARQNADAQRMVALLYLLQGQSVNSALRHLERLEANAKGSNSQSRFLAIPQVRELLGQLRAMEEVHLKIPEVKRLVSEKLRTDPSSRVIVFATWRDSVAMLIEALSEIEVAANVERFVGQSSRDSEKGMTQKEQVETLDRFRSGESNVLVCTSVGEEGLDVPSADRVIFYEPVASEIRTIQRRGRTARHREGDVYVLVSEDTRDVGVRYAAAAREARMNRVIEKVRRHRRPPRLHPNPDSLIEQFRVSTKGKEVPAAQFIDDEFVRLQPELGHADGLMMRDHKTEPEVPTSRIMRRDAPKMTPAALRPKTQLSITEFADTENEEPLEVSHADAVGNGKKDSDEGLTEGNDNGNANESVDKWRLPVLDGRDEDTGRAIDAAEDLVLGNIQDLGEGHDGDSGKGQSSD